jgi:hypothetical protein
MRFIDLRELFAVFTVGSFKLLNYLEDPVAARHRVVNHEFQSWSVFQNDGASHQALNALTVAREQTQPAFLLLGIAQDADEHNSRMQVARHIDIIDRYQASLIDGEFPANDFADLALQEFAHSL